MHWVAFLPGTSSETYFQSESVCDKLGEYVAVGVLIMQPVVMLHDP